MPLSFVIPLPPALPHASQGSDAYEWDVLIRVIRVIRGFVRHLLGAFGSRRTSGGVLVEEVVRKHA